MSVRAAQVLLACLISARATSFLFSKLLLSEMGPFTLMALRFLGAFVLLAIIFHRRLRAMRLRTFLRGTALGVTFFLVMSCDLNALVTASTTSVSFLENTAIVIVPLGEALLARRPPSPRATVCALVALVGVGLLSLGSSGLSLGIGEVIALVGAFFYAAAMMLTQRVSQGEDALVLGIVQVGWIGALGLIASLALEKPAPPASPLTWGYLAVLVVVCTGFGFTLQPVAQKPLSPEQASLMCALNPLVATIIGVLALGETITVQGGVGLACILAAIMAAVAPLPKHLREPAGSSPIR